MTQNENDMFFKATLLWSDAVNSNGRMYPKDVLEKAISSMRGDEMYGELRCDSDSMECTINIGNISHVVKDIHMEDGKLVGLVKIINTPKGEILKQLQHEKDYVIRPRFYDVSISKDENGVDVISDAKFISFDVIAEHKDSYREVRNEE